MGSTLKRKNLLCVVANSSFRVDLFSEEWEPILPFRVDLLNPVKHGGNCTRCIKPLLKGVCSRREELAPESFLCESFQKGLAV